MSNQNSAMITRKRKALEPLSSNLPAKKADHTRTARTSAISDVQSLKSSKSSALTASSKSSALTMQQGQSRLSSHGPAPLRNTSQSPALSKLIATNVGDEASRLAHEAADELPDRVVFSSDGAEAREDDAPVAISRRPKVVIGCQKCGQRIRGSECATCGTVLREVQIQRNIAGSSLSHPHLSMRTILIHSLDFVLDLVSRQGDDCLAGLTGRDVYDMMQHPPELVRYVDDCVQAGKLYDLAIVEQKLGSLESSKKRRGGYQIQVKNSPYVGSRSSGRAQQMYTRIMEHFKEVRDFIDGTHKTGKTAPSKPLYKAMVAETKRAEEAGVEPDIKVGVLFTIGAQFVAQYSPTLVLVCETAHAGLWGSFSPSCAKLQKMMLPEFLDLAQTVGGISKGSWSACLRAALSQSTGTDVRGFNVSIPIDENFIYGRECQSGPEYMMRNEGCLSVNLSEHGKNAREMNFTLLSATVSVSAKDCSKIQSLGFSRENSWVTLTTTKHEAFQESNWAGLRNTDTHPAFEDAGKITLNMAFIVPDSEEEASIDLQLGWGRASDQTAKARLRRACDALSLHDYMSGALPVDVFPRTRRDFSLPASDVANNSKVWTDPNVIQELDAWVSRPENYVILDEATASDLLSKGYREHCKSCGTVGKVDIVQFTGAHFYNKPNTERQRGCRAAYGLPDEKPSFSLPAMKAARESMMIPGFTEPEEPKRLFCPCGYNVRETYTAQLQKHFCGDNPGEPEKRHPKATGAHAARAEARTRKARARQEKCRAACNFKLTDKASALKAFFTMTQAEFDARGVGKLP